MARIPPVVRFLAEEYGEAPEWFHRFLRQLSGFTESVVVALQKNLTLEENISCQVQELTIRAGASATDNTAKISVPANRTPIGVTVLQVTQSANTYAANGSAVQIDWKFINGKVNINAITGLTSTTVYRLRLAIWF